jgi:ribosomal protein L11 methyltransferase
VHIKITFTNIHPEQQEWVIAHLSDAGYEGFEEKPDALIAFARADEFDAVLLKDIAFKYQLQYSEEQVADQNWNEIWESNFQPVRVGDFVSIRAPFHPARNSAQIEIVITPKMSFGTGHHATTVMMIEHMREINFTGQDVFDFGTGTGLLAILAEKLGAARVLATDNDTWSIHNSRENLLVNECKHSTVEMTDDVPEGKFGVILANINLHVILQHLPKLAGALKPRGQLVLSGFLDGDTDIVQKAAAREGLQLVARKTHKGWLSIRFSC